MSVDSIIQALRFLKDDLILQQSYAVLLEEAVKDGFEVVGEGEAPPDGNPCALIVSGDNGSFLYMQDGFPLLSHKLEERFTYPVQMAFIFKGNRHVTMVVEPPGISKPTPDRTN